MSVREQRMKNATLFQFVGRSILPRHLVQQGHVLSVFFGMLICYRSGTPVSIVLQCFSIIKIFVEGYSRIGETERHRTGAGTGSQRLDARASILMRKGPVMLVLDLADDDHETFEFFQLLAPDADADGCCALVLSSAL